MKVYKTKKLTLKSYSYKYYKLNKVKHFLIGDQSKKD